MPSLKRHYFLIKPQNKHFNIIRYVSIMFPESSISYTYNTLSYQNQFLLMYFLLFICRYMQFNPKLRFKVQRSCMVFSSWRLYAHPDYCGKHCIIEYSSSSTSHHYYHHFHLDISVHQEFLKKKFEASTKIPHYREYGHPEEHIQLKNEEFDGHIWDAHSFSLHFVVTLLCDHHLFICIELGTNAIPACG